MRLQIFALLFVPGLVAMPILGWVAVSRIRHSSGRLCGLGLAVFDGLFIPLVVLDCLLAWLCGLAVRAFPILLLVPPHGPTPAERLFALQILAAIIADFFVARAVWRLANAPPGNANAKPVAVAPQPLPFMAKLSLGLLLLGLLGTPLLLALAPASSQDAIAVFAVLALLLALGFGFASRTRLGAGVALTCITLFILLAARIWYVRSEFDKEVANMKIRMAQHRSVEEADHRRRLEETYEDLTLKIKELESSGLAATHPKVVEIQSQLQAVKSQLDALDSRKTEVPSPSRGNAAAVATQKSLYRALLLKIEDFQKIGVPDTDPKRADLKQKIQETSLQIKELEDHPDEPVELVAAKADFWRLKGAGPDDPEVAALLAKMKELEAKRGAMPPIPPGHYSYTPVIERAQEIDNFGGYNLETGEFIKYPYPHDSWSD